MTHSYESCISRSSNNVVGDRVGTKVSTHLSASINSSRDLFIPNSNDDVLVKGDVVCSLQEYSIQIEIEDVYVLEKEVV